MAFVLEPNASSLLWGMGLPSTTLIPEAPTRDRNARIKKPRRSVDWRRLATTVGREGFRSGP